MVIEIIQWIFIVALVIVAIRLEKSIEEKDVEKRKDYNYTHRKINNLIDEIEILRQDLFIANHEKLKIGTVTCKGYVVLEYKVINSAWLMSDKHRLGVRFLNTKTGERCFLPYDEFLNIK